MTIRPHTTDADVVVARLQVYDRVIVGIADAAAARLSQQAILNFMKDSAIMPGMVKFGRDRGSLDGAWRPLLSAPRHGDALPLPSIFG